MALVIKQWSVNENAEAGKPVVRIHGRQSGIISFLLSWIGVEPVTTLEMTRDQVIFHEGSWSGSRKYVLPISSLTSGYFGYTKPWQVALMIGVALMPFFFIGLVAGPLYYVLNKQLELGLFDSGGRTVAVAFKKSFIENKSIDEAEGMRVLNLIERAMASAKSNTENHHRAA